MNFTKQIKLKKEYVKFDFKNFMLSKEIDVRELAKISGCSRTAIYDSINRGLLKKEYFNKLEDAEGFIIWARW